MKILLFLMTIAIVLNVSAQSDTNTVKRKALADSSTKLHPTIYPRIASNNVTTISANNGQIKNNIALKTYLYWDPNLQMLIKKPYTSHYKDPKLLNPAQTVLSFLIPNNVGKP